MSYARFGTDSDVYVYAHVGGFIECCACSLGGNWEFYSTDAILAHLKEHIEAGHTVQPYTLHELEEDRIENDAWIKGEQDRMLDR